MNPSTVRPQQVFLTVAGPAALGVLLCLTRGLGATALGAVQLPAIIVGVFALMAPALYIGAALTGRNLAAETIVEASSTALSRAGLVMFGLVPALMFLSATVDDPWDARIAASLALAIATVISVPVLFAKLLCPDRRLLFTAWLVVGLGIAASLYVRTFFV